MCFITKDTMHRDYSHEWDCFGSIRNANKATRPQSCRKTGHWPTTLALELTAYTGQTPKAPWPWPWLREKHFYCLPETIFLISVLMSLPFTQERTVHECPRVPELSPPAKPIIYCCCHQLLVSSTPARLSQYHRSNSRPETVQQYNRSLYQYDQLKTL